MHVLSPTPQTDALDTTAERWEDLVQAFQQSGMAETDAARITSRLERYIEAQVKLQLQLAKEKVDATPTV